MPTLVVIGGPNGSGYAYLMIVKWNEQQFVLTTALIHSLRFQAFLKCLMLAEFHE